MKKRKMKQWLSLMLVVLMVLGTAACGKDGGEGGNSGSGSGSGGGKKNPNSQLAKQYVYSYEEIKVPQEDNSNIQGMSYVDGRVYLIWDVYYYNDSNTVGAVTDDTDGTAVGEVPGARYQVAAGAAYNVAAAVSVPMEEPAEDQYVPPTHVNKVMSFNLDGSDMQTCELENVLPETGNSWFNQMEVGQDGNVYAVLEEYVNDYSDPDNPIYEDNMSLITWDGEGKVRWKTPLNLDMAEGDYMYLNDMAVMEDGSVMALMGGSSYTMLTIDSTGNITANRKLEDLGNFYSSLLMDDGKVMILTTNEEWTKIFYSEFDPATGTSTEKVELPGSLMYNNSLNGFVDGKLMMSNDTGISACNVQTGEVEQLMSMINSDLSATYLSNICFIDQDHFLATYYDDDYEYVVASFTHVPPEDIPDKTVLVMGCMGLNSNIRRRVVEFNKTSELYRITVKDYSQYRTMDDYYAGYTQLNNDIISGSMPDILLPDNQLPVENYISKGLIADIGALIEKDEELSQKEFLTNVFDAYSVDGKLYYVVPSFTITTMVGKKSLVGDRTGWTAEEFNEVLAGLPEGTTAYGEMTRSDYLRYAMGFGGSQFVNAETGECFFDSQDFINVLEYASTLPEEIKYDENYDWTLYQNQYRENRTLLMTTTLYDVRTINSRKVSEFGEDISFVGFPNAERNGSVLEGYNVFVLSSQSTSLDGAWEFVRYYLTDEYLDSDEPWGIPVGKSQLDEMAKEATERPYWLNDDGSKEYYDETYWVNDEEVVIPPMTQEEADQVVAFICSVNRLSYDNDDILNIITEEAEPFFQGQKSAQDVAGIIQSRAVVFINENR